MGMAITVKISGWFMRLLANGISGTGKTSSVLLPEFAREKIISEGNTHEAEG